ncbi:S8 family serine peptidase [Azospirillum sp. Marseille-Q6669]
MRFVLEYRSPPDIDGERAAIKALLGSEEFALGPLFQDADADLSRFLVLTLSGADRPPLAAPLFSMGHALERERALLSCEPDLGAEVYADPEPDLAERGAESTDALGRLCWVDVDESHLPGHLWALDNMRVRDAWSLATSKGAGIIVAQPDTGIAAHDEIAPGNLRFDLATDIVEGDADPTDPLDPRTANPGHGTGTASVVISLENGRIAGSAPAATLVPIRCIQDVKVFDAGPVAAAIDHARRRGCHIVTMSLGGVPSRSVHRAIEKAVGEHMIVLAAAGNCVRTVVWPARYGLVIAVAGTNVADRPWLGSSRGDAVDVSAPAELVWRARRQAEDDSFDSVTPGQGTSFAVALTAGVAALWLGHHGRDAVVAKAKALGTTVQELFRNALRATARVPAGWDGAAMGAGIVDARALLELPLDGIPTAVPKRTPDPAGLEGLLADVAGDGGAAGAPDPAGFDWPAHGLEVAHLLLADARAGRAVSGRRREARSREAASAELRAAAAAAADPRLRALARGPRVVVPVVPAPPAALARGFAILGRRLDKGAESASPTSLETARDRLRTEGVQSRLDTAESLFRRRAERGEVVDVALQAQVLSVGEGVLTRFAANGELPPPTGVERLAFEALVSLTGRPALRVENRFLDLNAPEVESWLTGIEIGKPDIERVLPSVGRIDLEGEHIGTGFVVAPGVIMTNRHVLEAIAAPVPTRRSPARWVLLSDDTTVNFSAEADEDAWRFRVKDVLFAGPDPIEDAVNFAHLDLALLEVETANGPDGSLNALPDALPLSMTAKRAIKGRNLFVVGYPAQPVVPLGDFNGTSRGEIVEKLRQIFGLRYGRKYFSPGQVSAGAGTDAQDGKAWVLGHDATTLGGNSGSCVIHFGDPMAVVGLHFAGDWMRANHAHAMAVLRDVLAGATGPRSSFTWV